MREQEEKKWVEIAQQQKIEAEKRVAKIQLIDEDRLFYMKQKDANERLQRE